MTTSDLPRPRIEFPCEYPVKIVGNAGSDFLELVEGIVERHAPGYPRERSTLRYSGGGRFVAVTVTIVATGEPQLRALFHDLKATGQVHTVL